MRKLFLKSMLLLCALIVGSSSVWADNWELVKSSSQLEDDGEYLIVSVESSDSYYALSKANSSIRDVATVSVSEDVISATAANTTSSTDPFAITLKKSGDNWNLYDAVNEGYLNAGYRTTGKKPSNKNNLATGDLITTTTGNNGVFTITVTEAGVATITNQNGFVIQYNYNSGNPRIASYNGGGQTNVCLYKKVESTGEATTVTIDASGITNTNVAAGTAAGSLSAVVKNSSSEAISATVTWSSSNTAVATINETTGAVTLVKKGSTTIRATFAGGTIGINTYASSYKEYELIVTDPRQAMNINIVFNNDLYGTSFNGSGAKGQGDQSGSVNGVEVTASQGTATYFYISDTETRIYGDDGTMTITAPDGYLLTKIDVTKSSWACVASTGTLSDATWTGVAQSVVFTASSRTDFQSADITLAKALTITSAGWASLYLTFKAEIPEDVTVYYASSASLSGGTITLTPFDGDVIPANTGVVVKDGQFNGSASHTYAFNVADGNPTDNVSSNIFCGSASEIAVPDGGVYVLSSGTENSCTFSTFTGTTLSAYKAYIPKGSVTAPSIRFIVEDENGATNIEAIDATEDAVKFIQNGKLYIKKNNVVYDMLGTVVR